MTRSVIDPITRIEGHLRVEMEVTNGKVSDAWVSGGCFRGMEMVVENRTPEDAAQIEAATQALAKGTEAFAAQRMNRNIREALAGKSVQSIS